MSDPNLDALRDALAKPRDPDAASYDPRKPRLAVAAREAYAAKQETDEVHLVVGPREYVGLIPQAWIACDPDGKLPNPPMCQRTRDRAKATCPDCLAADDPTD